MAADGGAGEAAMSTAPVNSTLMFYPREDGRRRLFALWYFTTLLVLWTILGHTVLGFEQSWAAPVVGVTTAISLQVMLELVDARARRRPTRLQGSLWALADILPPAIIPGLACAMLIYPNDRLWPFAFAVSVAIGSKAILRAPVGNGRTQHIFNPSNLGIAATLVLFPWVGLAPAYHFTNHLTGVWLWAVPGIVLLSGILVHARFTGRLPLCLAWVSGFVLQALLRHWFVGSSWVAALVPMTSAAFIVFSLYMIPDPATTPVRAVPQAIFGFSVALVYGLLQILHVVFGLFIALVIVSAIRGITLYMFALRESQAWPAAFPSRVWATTSGGD
jgi:Na+-translocating ferredoxin:NAD+ oxidoreductase RnfD subunit